MNNNRINNKRFSQTEHQETGAHAVMPIPVASNQEVVRAIADAKDVQSGGKNLVFDPITGKFIVANGRPSSPDHITITSIVKDGFAKDEGHNSQNAPQLASNQEVVRAIADAKDVRSGGKNLVFDPITGKFIVADGGQPSPDYITITSIVKDGFATA